MVIGRSVEAVRAPRLRHRLGPPRADPLHCGHATRSLLIFDSWSSSYPNWHVYLGPIRDVDWRTT